MASIEDTAGGSARKAWIPPGYEALLDTIERQGRLQFGKEWSGEERRVAGRVLLADAYDGGELYGRAGDSVEDAERLKNDINSHRLYERASSQYGNLAGADLAAEKADIEARQARRKLSDGNSQRLAAARRWADASEMLRGQLATGMCRAFVVSNRGLAPVPDQYWFDDTYGPAALRDGVSVGTAEVRHSTTGPRGRSYTVDDLKVPKGPIVLPLTNALKKAEGAPAPQVVEPARPVSVGGAPPGWDWPSIVAKGAAYYAAHHASEGKAMKQAALIAHMQQLGKEQRGTEPGESTTRGYANLIIDAFAKAQEPQN